VVDELGNDRTIEEMHWGGGTPTFLKGGELLALASSIRKRFAFAKGGVSFDRSRSKNGFRREGSPACGYRINRVCIEVQDINTDVQKAIHRVQSFEETSAAAENARRAGFRSVDVDLIFCLPKQTTASFDSTIRAILELAPSRVTLSSYYNLPIVFKSQRPVVAADLLPPENKLEMMISATRELAVAGYVYVGLNSFARSDDELAIARRHGHFHRNIQGYIAGGDGDQLGVGVSAIGRIGPVYSQNSTELSDYYDRLDRNELPVLRGIELETDDLVRRAVMQVLTGRIEVSMESIDIAYLIDFNQYFSRELESLKGFVDDGLIDIDIDRDWITVSPKGGS
jgi:oxygen-independent coproporphyrinogen-3 oxidase